MEIPIQKSAPLLVAARPEPHLPIIGIEDHEMICGPFDKDLCASGTVNLIAVALELHLAVVVDGSLAPSGTVKEFGWQRQQCVTIILVKLANLLA